MSRAVLSAAVVATSLLAGCSATVAGHAVRAPRDALERALPDSSELTRVLGLTMESDSAPQFGGTAVLRDDEDVSSPAECAGVTHAGNQITYQGAPLRAVARGIWTTLQTSDDRVDVVISVAELDSSRSAQSWYGKTAARWAQCQGITVTETTSAVSFIQNIRRITDVDGTLDAELSVSTDNGLMAPQQDRRAFTATSQYLVDTEIFGTLRHARVSDLDAGAVARFIVSKIT